MHNTMQSYTYSHTLLVNSVNVVLQRIQTRASSLGTHSGGRSRIGIMFAEENNNNNVIGNLLVACLLDSFLFPLSVDSSV